MRLHGPSSPGVRSSFAAYPEMSVPGLIAEDHSPGVFHPFSAYRQLESTAVLRLSVSSRQDSTGGSQPTGYGAAHRLSQPLSDVTPRLPSCHFQTGNAHGFSPFKGFILPQSTTYSSHVACPPDFAPKSCATSVPGRGSLGHADRHLGRRRRASFTSSGPCSSRKSAAAKKHG